MESCRNDTHLFKSPSIKSWCCRIASEFLFLFYQSLSLYQYHYLTRWEWAPLADELPTRQASELWITCIIEHYWVMGIVKMFKQHDKHHTTLHHKISTWFIHCLFEIYTWRRDLGTLNICLTFCRGRFTLSLWRSCRTSLMLKLPSPFLSASVKVCFNHMMLEVKESWRRIYKINNYRNQPS